MIVIVRQHAGVEKDIRKLARWLNRNSREAALRFLESVETTLSGLKFMPGKGSRKPIRGRGIVDLRSWPVRGFPNHLILYDLRNGLAYVLAVTHGSKRYVRVIQRRAKQ